MKAKIKTPKTRIPRQSGRSATFADKRTKRLKTRQSQRREWE